MKKIICLILTIFSVAFSISAGDMFYYCNGNKVFLEINPSKIAVLSSNTIQLNDFALADLKINKIICDDISNVSVYDTDRFVSFDNAKREISKAFNNSNILPCYTNNEGLELVPTGYIYIKLLSDKDIIYLTQLASVYNFDIIRQNGYMPLWYTLHVSSSSDSNPVEIANSLYETGKFSSAFPEFSYNPLEISYDPYVYQQWGLYNSEYENIDISISEAWNYATGRGIKIAIVDQGIELNHDDLVDNIYNKSYDAYKNSSPSAVYNSSSSIGHGTHCAGIAGAVRNNGIMIAGVAPDSKLMSISCNFDALNDTEQFANGINWAWQNGADIISCSWRSIDNDLIRNALDQAITLGREGKGCIIVKSAGNTGGSITFPGYYREEIIAVGNIKKEGVISSSSSHGPNMLLCAPGTNILSTMVGNSTSFLSGTSMACPHVSGVAALILERNPSLTADKVREILAKNTKQIGDKSYSTIKKYGAWNEYYGYGLVDAYKAVINTPR